MTTLTANFPTGIGFGSSAQTQWNKRRVSTPAGYSQTNQLFSKALMKYDVASGVKSLDDCHELIRFFNVMMANDSVVLFTDKTDFKSCAPLQVAAYSDSVIGTGDGADTTFQLYKRYSAGGLNYDRKITRPMTGTVKIGVNGSELLSGWTVNVDTGIVTFSSPPANGHVITAGFHFYVPVDFVDSSLDWVLDKFRAGTLDGIMLEEVQE